MKYQLRTKNSEAPVRAEASGRRGNSLVGLYLLIRKMSEAVEVKSKAQQARHTAYQGADGIEAGPMWAY